MSTALGKKYPPEWDGAPPRMSKEDFEIWKRYKPKIIKDSLWMFYDVGLGEGIEVQGDVSVEIGNMWTQLTQKRADVIIQRKNYIDIVELRYSASVNAIGRLKLYMMLYLRDPILGVAARPILVSDRFDRDVSDLARLENIEYVIV